MGRVADFATAPDLATALGVALVRDGAEVLRLSHPGLAGPGGGIIPNPLNEKALAAAFASVGVLDGLACTNADGGPVNPEDLSWTRWTAASRGITSVALVTLKHGGLRVADGGAIVLTAAPGRRDAGKAEARAVLSGPARGASGGFTARAIRVNHVAAGAHPSPEAQAEAMAFLLSGQASFVTGADICRERQEER
jgi:hypothetical protein